jgi:membrane protein implicated in regulation of membrane protease activity
MLFAVVISLVLTYGLPTWASITVALAAVLVVSIGGGALLAKVVAVCALVVVGIWLVRRHKRRQPLRRDKQWPTVTAAKTKAPEAEAHRPARRVA